MSTVPPLPDANFHNTGGDREEVQFRRSEVPGTNVISSGGLRVSAPSDPVISNNINITQKYFWLRGAENWGGGNLKASTTA